MYTASITFFGQYRPAYFEAETAGKAIAAAIRAIPSCSDYNTLARWLNEAYGQIKKPNCSSYSIEHGCRGVSIVARAHDPFLDSVTASLPAYPGLDYTGATNV
jgi:hypothetical protein